MITRFALSTLLLAFAANHAAAIPVTVSANGQVTHVFVADPFGTAVGDAITLHAAFDSAALVDAGPIFGIEVPGVQFASLADPGASLLIELGARTWTELSEPFFGSDFFGLFPTALPHVVLLNGEFVGLNFFGIGPGDDVLVSDSVGQLYFGSAPLGLILGGNSDPDSPPFWLGQWDLRGATVTVPEPATWTLLLLGALAALAPSSRRWRKPS